MIKTKTRFVRGIGDFSTICVYAIVVSAGKVHFDHTGFDRQRYTTLDLLQSGRDRFVGTGVIIVLQWESIV